MEQTKFKNFVKPVCDIIFAKAVSKIGKNACVKDVSGWNEWLTRMNVVNLRGTHILTKNRFS